jgi:hypothetical protein
MYMNSRQSRFWVALGLVFGTFLSFDLAITAPAVEAACRPSGRYAAGQRILNCSGRTRCRPTGRIKVVRGVRYQVLRCPR